MMLCAIWDHLYNLKNMKNIHREVLLSACNFTKSNTPPWVFFTFLKLYKWYQIAQRITHILPYLYSFFPFNRQKNLNNIFMLKY